MVKRIIGGRTADFDNDKSNYSMLQYEIVASDNKDTDPDETVERLCFVAVQYRGTKQVFCPELLSDLLLAMIRVELTTMDNIGDTAPYVAMSVPAYFRGEQLKQQEKWQGSMLCMS